MDVTVRGIEVDDRAAWDELYAGYARFYKTEQTAAMRDRVWGWLSDPANPVRGLVAVDAHDVPVGLAHFRPFHRPLSATIGCYLDDLFVAHAARRSTAAARLLGELERIARAEGWSVVRGITRENNYRARVLYDRFATRTEWVTYDAIPAPVAGTVDD